jgi:hypothetical protein
VNTQLCFLRWLPNNVCLKDAGALKQHIQQTLHASVCRMIYIRKKNAELCAKFVIHVCFSAVHFKSKAPRE